MNRYELFHQSPGVGSVLLTYLDVVIKYLNKSNLGVKGLILACCSKEMAHHCREVMVVATGRWLVAPNLYSGGTE